MGTRLGHGANALRNLAACLRRGGARRPAADQDRILRQIGCELHDGPAQLIGLALLKLDAPRAAPGDSETIRAVLLEALEEVRAISAGLLLPDVGKKSLEGALLGTIRDHERRTGSLVSFVADRLTAEPRLPVVSCLCRAVREALMNAFRHAGGKGQAVVLRSDRDGLIVEVRDRGPGIAADACPGPGHMGLIGMRARVESIGGTLKIERRFNGGTRLTIRAPLGLPMETEGRE